MMKKVLAVIMAAALLFALALPASAKEFSDVQESDWYYGAVNRWSDLGVIDGYEDGSFKPDNPIKRSEFAKILVTVFKAPDYTGENPFTDVDVSKWDGKPVLAAYGAGWMNGETTTKFNRNGYLTREAGFAVFRRALGISALSAAEADEVLAAFSDGSKTDDWAKGEVAALVKAGYVSGDGKTLKPLDNLTRAELVVLLDKLTGNDYNSTTRAYDDNKLYITEKGDYEVKDPKAIVIIATKDPVTLTGDAKRVIVAPGAEGGQLNLEDGNFGDVVVQAEKYSVASQPGSTVENVVNEDGKNVTLTFTVSFDWNIKDDPSPKSETAYVKDGEKVGSERIFPTTRDGYTFDGWFTTKEKVDGETAFDFDTAIDQSYTLYAHWTEDSTPVEPTPSEGEYKVTFDADGGSAVETQIVKEGEKAKKPADPTKEGYEFKGWFAGETEYDFTAAVTADVALKAKWNILSYTVTLNAEGGEAAYETKKVPYGTEIEEPTATRSGYNFIAWVDADGKEVEFPYAVKADVTFKAKWEKGPVFTVVYEPVDGVTYAGKSTYNVKTGDKHTLKTADGVNTAANKGLKNWLVRSADAVGTDSAVEYAAGEEITVTGNLIVTPVLSARIQVVFKDGIDESLIFPKTTDTVGNPPAFIADHFYPGRATTFTGVGTNGVFTIGEGGNVVIDEDPTKVGYTFAGYKIVEPVWADQEEVTVKRDATTKKPQYNLVTFDPAEAVTDDDGDGFVYVFMTWEAVDLNAVVYSSTDANNVAVPSASPPGGLVVAEVKAPYNSLVKGLAMTGDATITSDEVAAINLTYDAVVAAIDGNATTAKPAIFVKAPKGIVAGATPNKAKVEAIGATAYAAAVKAGSYTYAQTTNAAAITTMTIDETAVPGVKIDAPAAATPYVVLQFFSTDGNNAVTAQYIINLTTYATDEVADVAVNLGLAGAKLYKGEVKDANEVKSLFNVATLTMPIGATIETPEAGSLLKKADGSVASSFEDLKVLDKNNEVVTAADGKYTVAAGMKVSFNWGATATVTFNYSATQNDDDAYKAGTGVQMDPVQVGQKTVYKLPECKFTAPHGEVFAGWDVTVTGGASDGTYNGKAVGWELSVDEATAITLTAKWATGHTVTLSTGMGDDANTSENETVVFVKEFVGATGLTYTVPNDIADVEFDPAFTVPAGYKFGGWVATYFDSNNKEHSLADGKQIGDGNDPTVKRESVAVLGANKTLQNAEIQKDPVLTAKWIPDVTFEADPSYFATLSGASKLLTDDGMAALPALTFTPYADKTKGNVVAYKISTAEGVVVPYSDKNVKFSGITNEQKGHYLAVTAVIPKTYNLDAVSQTNSGNSTPYTPLSAQYDRVGTYSTVNTDKKITTIFLNDDIANNNGFQIHYDWGNGLSTDYRFYFDGIKYGWPVEYVFGSVAKDANNKDLEKVVVTVEDGAELTVADEAIAQAAKAVGLELKESGAWQYTQGSTTDAPFDPLKHVKVTGPTTMTAQWDDAKVTLTVDLDGGTLNGNAATSNDMNLGGITDKVTTKKVKYGSAVTLPTQDSDNGITKPGALLKSWKVDGIEVAADYGAVTVTKDTKIEAVWTSYLGTVDVAPLADATDATLTVVDEDSYKVGYYKTENKVKTFVDQTGTGTGVANASNEVALTIKADGLVKHSNTAKVYGATTKTYWVGLKITPPAGVTHYKAASTGFESSEIKALPTDGFITYYVDVDSDVTDQAYAVQWFKGSTVNDNYGAAVTYKLSTETTKLITDAYKITVKGGTADVVRNVKAGAAMNKVLINAPSGNYWDAATVAAAVKTNKIPDTFTVKVIEGSDGKTTQLEITGTVPENGLATLTPTWTFVSTPKVAAPAIYVDDFEFVASGVDSGEFFNNSDTDIIIKNLNAGASGDNLTTPIKVAAGKSVVIVKDVKANIYIKVPETYTTKESDNFTAVAVVASATAPNLTPTTTGIIGGAKYVTGFQSGVVYEYKKSSESTWQTLTTLTAKNIFVGEATAYDFRIKANDNALASATTTLDLAESNTVLASGTISITNADGTAGGTAAIVDGVASNLAAGTYVITDTDVEVTISSTTRFNAAPALTKKATA